MVEKFKDFNFYLYDLQLEQLLEFKTKLQILDHTKLKSIRHNILFKNRWVSSRNKEDLLSRLDEFRNNIKLPKKYFIYDKEKDFLHENCLYQEAKSILNSNTINQHSWIRKRFLVSESKEWIMDYLKSEK